jgi:hypothetical protein
MMYVVTLNHTPEQCLARKEFAPEYKAWLAGMDDLAKRLGIQVHEACVCPNEHTFWFILDAGDINDVTAFLSGFWLTQHAGRVSPVVSLREASDILIK